MNEFIKSVDDVTRLELLPTLLNSIVPEVHCQLYSLLLRHGGLGTPILSGVTKSQFPNFLKFQSASRYNHDYTG